MKRHYEYETVRLNSRRSKAKHLWSSRGWEVEVYKRDRRGTPRPTGEKQTIATHAYSIPLEFEFVEAVVVDGVPAYHYQEGSQSHLNVHPSSAPLLGGGRFKMVRTHSDGAPVLRTLYLYDLPGRLDGKTQDIRVVFSWVKRPKKVVRHVQKT